MTEPQLMAATGILAFLLVLPPLGALIKRYGWRAAFGNRESPPVLPEWANRAARAQRLAVDGAEQEQRVPETGAVPHHGQQVDRLAHPVRVALLELRDDRVEVCERRLCALRIFVVLCLAPPLGRPPATLLGLRYGLPEGQEHHGDPQDRGEPTPHSVDHSGRLAGAEPERQAVGCVWTRACKGSSTR